jgi:putative transposase
MKHLLHDRDTQFRGNSRQLIRTGGVQRLARPARSPKLDAFAERWVRTVRDECLNTLILYGRAWVERALNAYARRNEPEVGNVIPMPRVLGGVARKDGEIVMRRPLGGVLGFDVRRAG